MWHFHFRQEYLHMCVNLVNRKRNAALIVQYKFHPHSVSVYWKANCDSKSEAMYTYVITLFLYVA
jgi:hypothetical protein